MVFTNSSSGQRPSPTITAGTPTAPWLTASTNGNTLTMSANLGGLSAGLYSATIPISASAYASIQYPVVLVVEPPTPGETMGTVTVAEAIPAGLTLVSMAGSGWTCPANGTTCTRSDPLLIGASYPPIAVIVNVAADAPATVTNQVTVTGGGSAPASATDLTTINPLPALTAAKTHSGSFTQGQIAATYSVTVSNGPAAGPTYGTVTVTENIPNGLSLVSMGGQDWTCPSNGTSCTRSDSLPAGDSYSPVIVTVSVNQNAPSWVTNQVTVSGGGSTSSAASDLTAISGSGGTLQSSGTTIADIQQLIDEALGMAPAENQLTGDGLVSVVDVQIALGAALGYGANATMAIEATLTASSSGTFYTAAGTAAFTGALSASGSFSATIDLQALEGGASTPFMVTFQDGSTLAGALTIPFSTLTAMLGGASSASGTSATLASGTGSYAGDTASFPSLNGSGGIATTGAITLGFTGTGTITGG
jgi:hypothetical protein